MKMIRAKCKKSIYSIPTALIAFAVFFIIYGCVEQNPEGELINHGSCKSFQAIDSDPVVPQSEQEEHLPPSSKEFLLIVTAIGLTCVYLGLRYIFRVMFSSRMS